jgi:predicted outer membrane repeat protein
MKAGDEGGGVSFFAQGSGTITDSTVSDNSAGNSGGGIQTSFAPVTVTNSTVSGNSANFLGGGIYTDGPVTVTDSALTDNSSGTFGGGIYAAGGNPGTQTVTDSAVSGNTAGTSGGGIYNAATLAVRGLVTIDGGYIQTAAGTLTLEAGNTLVLAGLGTIDGSLSTAGTLALGDATGPGLLTISGDYTQAATGTLSLNIGGTQAGTDYSQLVVNGLATLDGTLDLHLVNGYQPQHRDRFHPLLWSSVSGTFANYTGDAGEFLIVYVYAPGYEDSGWPVGLTLVAH